MKVLTVMILSIILSGCAGGEFFPKGYGHELAHKCQIDLYHPDCLNPPPAFKN